MRRGELGKLERARQKDTLLPGLQRFFLSSRTGRSNQKIRFEHRSMKNGNAKRQCRFLNIDSIKWLFLFGYYCPRLLNISKEVFSPSR